MPVDAWGHEYEITAGAYGCQHRHADGSFCNGKEAGYAGVKGWCWTHRPREAGAKVQERAARAARKLADQALQEANAARNAAREEYAQIESELLEAVLEAEEALPRELRALCVRLRVAEDARAKASAVADARWSAATEASDAYERARKR